MPAAVVGGIIAGAGSIGGAAIGSHAASKATQAETEAGQQSLALQKDIYNTTRGDLAPYRNAGTEALGSPNGLMNLLGLNAGALGTIGQGASMAGSLMGGGGQSDGLTRDSSANYPMQMGAISDPSKNGGYAGQVPGTNTLGDPGGFANNTATGYAPHSSPIPTLKFQHSDGTVYMIPANQVAQAQKEDPTGKVLGPANG